MNRTHLFALLSVMLAAPTGAYAIAALSIPYQLTHTENADPSFAPGGKRMVYIQQVAGREQLVTASAADGSAQILVTHDDADHEDPSWSPDGKLIAFVHLTKDEERIYVMNPDGSGVRAVSPAGKRTIHPQWSADSKRVIYCTDDDLAPPRKNNSDIEAVDLVTSRVTTLITGGVNTYPVWSPDMRHLVFRRMMGETNSEVFIADGDGKNARNLTNNPAFDGWPAWSPDGKRIAFASNRFFKYQIFVMNADGTEVQLVANTEGRATVPRWSPDGKAIYFSDCVSKDYGFDCEILVSRMPG